MDWVKQGLVAQKKIIKMKINKYVKHVVNCFKTKYFTITSFKMYSILNRKPGFLNICDKKD